MSAWLSKWGPLSGALSALLVVASLATGSNTPNSNQTGLQVIQWYTVNHNQRTVSDLLAALGMLFLVAFATVLARHVRRGERWIAGGALAGAVCAAIGLTSAVGFDLVLATDTNKLTPGSAQTLNLLQNGFFLPLVLGIALFAILGGLAVVAGRILPAWTGWVLFAVGLAALVPPVSWFALMATLLWVLAAGIWMTRQGPPAVELELVAAEEQVPSLT